MKKETILKNSFICLAILLFAGCNGNTQNSTSFNSISVEEAEKLRNQDDVILLDVRTDNEFNQAHVPEARQIDVSSGNFSEKVSQLDQNKTYILYCHSGRRSAKAADIMSEQGFNNIYNMQGGFSEWQNQNLPIEK